MKKSGFRKLFFSDENGVVCVVRGCETGKDGLYKHNSREGCRQVVKTACSCEVAVP